LSGDGTTRPPYSGRALFVGEFRHAVREAAIDNRRLARQRQLPTVLRLPAGEGKRILRGWRGRLLSRQMAFYTARSILLGENCAKVG
jgi:hypothetical protein